MKTKRTPPRLSALPQTALSPKNEEALKRAARASLGAPPWRERKLIEARGLLALSQMAERMEVRALDMRTDLMAVVWLRTAVGCLPPGSNELVVESEAELVIRYPRELMTHAIPGWASVRILRPSHTHHPNSSNGAQGAQCLCLGPRLEAGWPATEIILGTYAALTMQSVTLDRADPAGVMNPEAAAFFEVNRGLIPLSREPFLSEVAQ